MGPHLTPELLQAFRQGKLAYDELLDLIFGHLPDACPHCRAGFAALEEEELSGSYRLAGYFAALACHGPELLEAEARAARDLRDLKALTPAARKPRILQAYRRFRGESLVCALLAEQERHLHKDPLEAFHWAELAWTVAGESSQMEADYFALACALMGNARRAGGDLREADKLFQHVRYLVERYPVTDTRALARILHVEGSLRKDQRLFRQARKALRRSEMLFRVLGDELSRARVLMTLSLCYSLEGRGGEAIQQARRVLDLIDEEADPQLYFWARQNLVLYLVDSGYLDEALVLRTEDRSYQKRWFAEIDQARLIWLDARIARGLGRAEQAERLLLQARSRFLKKGISYCMTMVDRDLAALWADMGRLDDSVRLEEEVLREIAAQGVASGVASKP